MEEGPPICTEPGCLWAGLGPVAQLELMLSTSRAGLRGRAHQESRWHHEPHELGVRHSGQEGGKDPWGGVDWQQWDVSPLGCLPLWSGIPVGSFWVWSEHPMSFARHPWQAEPIGIKTTWSKLWRN